MTMKKFWISTSSPCYLLVLFPLQMTPTHAKTCNLSEVSIVSKLFKTWKIWVGHENLPDISTKAQCLCDSDPEVEAKRNNIQHEEKKSQVVDLYSPLIWSQGPLSHRCGIIQIWPGVIRVIWFGHSTSLSIQVQLHSRKLGNFQIEIWAIHCWPLHLHVPKLQCKCKSVLWIIVMKVSAV